MCASAQVFTIGLAKRYCTTYVRQGNSLNIGKSYGFPQPKALISEELSIVWVVKLLMVGAVNPMVLRSTGSVSSSPDETGDRLSTRNTTDPTVQQHTLVTTSPYCCL